MTTHKLRRGTYKVSGFATADRQGHVERERPYGDREQVRLHVAGTVGVGFGIGAVDADLFYNLGPGRPTAQGPTVYAYGLPAVIDNHGGTAAEIATTRAAGLVVEAELGDLLEVDGRLWRIDLADRGRDRHNVVLTLTDEAEPEPVTLADVLGPATAVAPGVAMFVLGTRPDGTFGPLTSDGAR